MLTATFSLPLWAQSGFSGQAAVPGGVVRGGALLTAGELDNLLAPIALFPDVLLAQMLPAATYPFQVVAAAQFVRNNPDPNAIDSQDFDPSIKALARYPEVLEKLAADPDWTSAVGAAFMNQQADVMAAIQRLRAQARTAGTLQSGPQVTVVEQPGEIRIVSSDPDIVVVPTYDPVVVYNPVPVSTVAFVPTVGWGWPWGWCAPGWGWGGWGGWGGGWGFAFGISWGSGCAVGPWLANDCFWGRGFVGACRPGYWGGWRGVPRFCTTGGGWGWAGGGRWGGVATPYNGQYGTAWRRGAAGGYPGYYGRYAGYGGVTARNGADRVTSTYFRDQPIGGGAPGGPRPVPFGTRPGRTDAGRAAFTNAGRTGATGAAPAASVGNRLGPGSSFSGGAPAVRTSGGQYFSRPRGAAGGPSIFENRADGTARTPAGFDRSTRAGPGSFGTGGRPGAVVGQSPSVRGGVTAPSNRAPVRWDAPRSITNGSATAAGFRQPAAGAARPGFGSSPGTTSGTPQYRPTPGFANRPSGTTSPGSGSSVTRTPAVQRFGTPSGGLNRGGAGREAMPFNPRSQFAPTRSGGAPTGGSTPRINATPRSAPTPRLNPFQGAAPRSTPGMRSGMTAPRSPSFGGGAPVGRGMPSMSRGGGGGRAMPSMGYRGGGVGRGMGGMPSGGGRGGRR